MLTLFMVLLLWMPQANAGAFDALFGYAKAEQSDDIDVFPQWRAVLARPPASGPEVNDCSAGNKAPSCHLRRWKEFLVGLRNKPAAEQLAAVNDFVNQQDYVGDDKNYGRADYWAQPDQFLSRGGDCEDYAILKFFSLRQLGWPPESLRLVVVQDTKLKQPHAILAVAEGEDVWILDNQARDVVSQETIEHYAPVYSLGDEQWWLYSPAG